MKQILLIATALLCACTTPTAPPAVEKSLTEPAAPPAIQAALIASDPSWGNTEGPAIDSKNNLYFTSRGTWKGIVRWNKTDGAQRYAAVAAKAGPGGLWIDAADNLFLTATDEREVWKLDPAKKVTVIARRFEADPKIAKGPNDLVVAANGTVYFTDPNGYYGDSPNGTVYRIDPRGRTHVFSIEITGPNGIILSQDERTLYVSHNISKDTSKIVSWPLGEDGSAGPLKTIVTVPNCVADGMAVDSEGALWLTCYSFGTAYRITPADGKITARVTTEQKALTNAKFGRGSDNRSLYLTSSDMERVTGYIYRAEVPVPGPR
jgi:gluconolactonase